MMESINHHFKTFCFEAALTYFLINYPGKNLKHGGRENCLLLDYENLEFTDFRTTVGWKSVFHCF